MSLERYPWPPEWTDGKALNRRGCSELAELVLLWRAEQWKVSPFKKKYKNHSTSSISLLCWPPRVATSIILLILNWD